MSKKCPGGLKLFIRGMREALKEVPTCPMCKGTGDAVQFSEVTYWRGEQVTVCAQCHGRGKV